MAWPSVLNPQCTYQGAVLANKVVTLQLVQQIHYCIECCLLQGLTLDETVVALQHLGVHERLTRITWKQLELQNPSFFREHTKEVALKAERCSSVKTPSKG